MSHAIPTKRLAVFCHDDKLKPLPFWFVCFLSFCLAAASANLLRMSRKSQSTFGTVSYKISSNEIPAAASIIDSLAANSKADMAAYYSLHCFNLTSAYEKCALDQRYAVHFDEKRGEERIVVARTPGDKHKNDVFPMCVLMDTIHELSRHDSSKVVVKPFSLSGDDDEYTLAAMLVVKDGKTVCGMLVLGWKSPSAGYDKVDETMMAAGIELASVVKPPRM